MSDHVCALDQILDERITDEMDNATQALADGLHALGATATTVQNDLTRSLAEMQTVMIEDRAATIQCLWELRESMQAMTTMMGQMANLIQSHNTLPMMIDTHGGSSPTNTPTPSSHDDSVTASILSNITTTLSTMAVGQDNLTGTIAQLSSAVTAMTATNQSQLRSTIDHITTTTRESSEATVDALQQLSMDE